jgi:hypothetical protein
MRLIGNGPLARIEAANRARAKLRASDTPKPNTGTGNVALFPTGTVPISPPGYGAKPWAESGASPSVKRIEIDYPVIGFRSWAVSSNGQLTGAGVPMPWTDIEMTATCGYNPSHHAPEHCCECGLYAYYDLKSISYQGIVGAVVAWGEKFEAHAEGFRAEHMRIIALAEPEEGGLVCWFPGSSVPVVPRDRLVNFALEHGEPLPMEMRFNDGVFNPRNTLQGYIEEAEKRLREVEEKKVEL